VAKPTRLAALRAGGGEISPTTNLTNALGDRAMDFDISRLHRAEKIIGGGAIALLIFLFFFKWYGVSSNVTSIAGLNINVSKTGWETFTNSRWIWLLTIIAALAAVLVVATQRKLQLPLKPGAIVAGLGALSTVLIFYRIVHHPTASANIGSFHASAGIKIGIWLGLIASAAITYGGYLAMQEEAAPTTAAEEPPSAPFTGLVASGAPATTPATSMPAQPVAPPIPEPAAQPAPPEPGMGAGPTPATGA
jgi:hypothetical protein